LEATRPEHLVPAAAAMTGVAERIRVLGSLALALCHLADGRVDAVASLRPRGGRAIDIAAGQLVVREAGSVIALPDAPGPFAAAPLDLEGRSRVVAAGDERSLARVAALLGIGPGG
jgi:myo-inositol-1(or 4)-monophosphatase